LLSVPNGKYTKEELNEKLTRLQLLRSEYQKKIEREYEQQLQEIVAKIRGIVKENIHQVFGDDVIIEWIGDEDVNNK